MEKRAQPVTCARRAIISLVTTRCVFAWTITSGTEPNAVKSALNYKLHDSIAKFLLILKIQQDSSIKHVIAKISAILFMACSAQAMCASKLTTEI